MPIFRSFLRPVDPAGPLAQADAADIRPVVLVTLLGAAASARDRALRLHHSGRGHRAIFVVTDPDIAAIRAAGMTAEHMPAPDLVKRFRGVGDWESYLRQRWVMIQTKWQPAMGITEGLAFHHYLRECGFSDSVNPAD
ncbi:MAG: hypothetical protein HC844_07540 [Tabrizicola sp.]|nr:hypothetical protein [Tabrizicola sp.]